MARTTIAKQSTTTPRPARKTPKKTSSLDEHTVTSGRGLAALTKKYAKQIAAYNPKLFPAAQVTEYDGLVRTTTTAIANHQSGGSVAGATLATKRGMIATLVEDVSTIRDEVRLAKPNDTKLHAAVGVGMRLSRKVAKDAIAMAALQQKSFEGTTFGPAMRAAGITQARIRGLEATRRDAAAAQAALGAAKGRKTGEAMTKDQLVRELAKWNTRAVDIGALVFKKNPEVRKQFEQYRARRKSASGAKPAPAPTAPPPTTP